MKKPDFQKIAVEIYLLFHACSGAISSVSGFLGRNDASKISRQINPNDDRRDNPYEEVLEIQRALMSFSPELEAQVWGVLERERSLFRRGIKTKQIETAEHIQKTFAELGDVIYKHSTGAPQHEMVKKTFELYQAGKDLYENVAEIESESVN